ncbi:glutathione transferase GTE1 [Cytidiella melzeri]|nr:glutathione transferase GTE1 [Cytidiella melzeri]
MSDSPIIFYDIPSKSTTSKAWSPHTWKVRFALNIKGLAYRTEWVEYPDIKGLYKKLNLPPASILKDGSEYTCLPVIHDPSTNKTMCESFDIVRYLDKTYPDTQPLLPKEIVPFSAAFLHAFGPTVQQKLWNVVVCAVSYILNDRSEEYFRRTREAAEGKKLEEIGGEREWEEAEAGFGTLSKWLDKEAEGNLLFMGDKISFPDLQIAGCLLWAKASLGQDSEGWKRICGWHGGRWKAIDEKFQPYMAVL